MSQSIHTASNEVINRALSKMPVFTVSELQTIKEALFWVDSQEHNLIAKIWQAQRATIKKMEQDIQGNN